MQVFEAEIFCSSWGGAIHMLRRWDRRDPDELVSEGELKVAKGAITDGLCAFASSLDLRETADAAFRFSQALSRASDFPVTARVLVHHLKAMVELAESELKKRKVLALPVNIAKFYDQERPMGEAIYRAFKSARFDITQAGNCLACGNNFASAFHLMRAVEVGLWALAADRQIPLAGEGRIEFSNWGRIIGQLEKVAGEVQGWRSSPEKEQAHEFYNKALAEIRTFNDGWRRHLAHVRPSPGMDESEAVALWGHVSRFLGTLASRLSEGE